MLPKGTSAMAVTREPVQENRFVLSTDWEGYLKFLEAAEDRRIRITYDRGSIELLSPSLDHELVSELLNQILVEYFVATHRGFKSGGSTTFRKRLLDRGLEPDKCYWLESRGPVRRGYDPETGPPPDLALEVEISASALDRLGIYRALGVREVWRYTKDHRVLFLVLAEDGYTEVPVSPRAPDLTPAKVREFVDFGAESDTSDLIRAVREWAEGLGGA